jgi:hypothetical protein
MSPPTRNELASRRWWRWLVPRFSLRTMLIATTLLCVVLGTWITRAEQQRAACRAFFENGGNSYGHAKWNADGKDPWWLAKLPEILREGRAEHYWTSVEYIGVSERAPLPQQLDAARQFPALKTIKFDQLIPVVPADTWPAVAKVPYVRRLEFFHANIDDRTLGQFSSISNLRELRLWWCERVGNVGVENLAGCRGLEVLQIESCPISNRALVSIGQMKSLRKLRITSAEIDDDGLSALYDLPNVRFVEFEHTRVTPSGAAKLQEKLSRCRVTTVKPLPPVQPKAASS